MKLIATLATLAALVGQTEAAQNDAHVESVLIGDAPCTDKVTLTVYPHANLIQGTTFYFSSTKLTTNTVAQVLTGVTTTACDTADAKAATVFGAAPSYAAGKWTWTVGSGGCDTSETLAAGASPTKILRVTLDNVCNNGATDYTGAAIGLKFKTSLTAAVELDSDQTAAAATLSTGNNNAKVLADFTVVDMPVAANTTGPFKATWTGVAALNNLKLVLNLPKDYKIPGGSTCNITSAKTSPTIVTLRASSVTADSTNSILFTTAIGASTLDATSTTTLNCDKVKSGATIAANVADAVSVKAHSTSNQNTHVAYAVANTPKPTAKPTAKAADSPASVATASGVVVGALGVAALFLA